MEKTTNQAVTAAANDQQELRLPMFDKVISIEVDVDNIYKRLMDTFPGDYKHREILSHAIIGSTLRNGSIGYIYNALNGMPNDIDFKVGDKVMCMEKERVEWYLTNPVVDGVVEALYVEKWDSRHVEIGQCEVIEIDMYAKDKLKVAFTTGTRYRRTDEPQLVDSWVNHKKCTILATRVTVEEYMDNMVEATKAVDTNRSYPGKPKS